MIYYDLSPSDGLFTKGDDNGTWTEVTSDYVQLMMISLPVRFRECSSSSGDRKKIGGDGRVCRNLRSKQCHHHLVIWVHDRPVGIISCVARHSNLVHFCRSFLSQSALDNFLTPLSVG